MSASIEEEIETFYDHLNGALGVFFAHYSFLIDDFNAKLGKGHDDFENLLGKYGYGKRNEGESSLLKFLQEYGFYSMCSFFDKKQQQKWTWISPDGITKKEIDIISNRKEIIHNVTTPNSFSIEYDEKVMRSRFSINITFN